MKSPWYFIIEPLNNKRYDNEVELTDEITFVTSVNSENFKASNRFGTVIDTPYGYKGEIKKGDVICVHHNVFKFYNNLKQRQASGWSYLRDGTFMVSQDQFYMFKRDGVWKTLGKYCFVKPIDALESTFSKGAVEEPLIGEMIHCNEELEALGVFKGDLISFTPDSEYEFQVDGEKLYRMFTNNITIKFEKNELSNI